MPEYGFPNYHFCYLIDVEITFQKSKESNQMVLNPMIFVYVIISQLIDLDTYNTILKCLMCYVVFSVPTPSRKNHLYASSKKNAPIIPSAQ